MWDCFSITFLCSLAASISVYGKRVSVTLCDTAGQVNIARIAVTLLIYSVNTEVAQWILLSFITFPPSQDDFSHLRPLCYPDVDVVIVCFSTVDPESYENIKSKWAKEVRRHCPGVPIILVGTKVDRREDPFTLKDLKSKGRRPIWRSDGNKLLSQIKGTCYVECSALTQLNIKNAFDEAIAAALELSSSGSGKRLTHCVKRGCTIL